MSDPAADPAIRAQGKLVMFLASLLAARGVAPADEFARLLEVFALTVEETEPLEGAVLAYWASCVAAGASN
jgi:hypothetical protein